MMSGNPLASEIVEKYGNRVRLRVSGLCWKDERLLMVNHSLTPGKDFWAPPGGGIEFGQSAHDALKREFLEETSIVIKPGQMLFTCELLRPPLHAVELFFEAHYQQGKPITGTDPESTPHNQIIKDVRYLEFDEVIAIPGDERHGIFRLINTLDDLKKLRGFYRI